MSNEGIFYVFTGTPLYYVMLPMIGLLMTTSSLVKGYELSKAKDKNLDSWLDFIASALGATLTSISLYGSVAATYLGLNFSLGPWFFLASIGVAFLHQCTMAGLNIYRACKSEHNAFSRKHFLQAGLNNFFNLGLITAISGAVLFVMLTPIAPAVGSACALTAVAFSGLNILWKMLPYNWKKGIKGLLGLGKPEVNLDETKLKASFVLESNIHLAALSKPIDLNMAVQQDVELNTSKSSEEPSESGKLRLYGNEEPTPSFYYSSLAFQSHKLKRVDILEKEPLLSYGVI
jgi:hypothetical protein